MSEDQTELLEILELTREFARGELRPRSEEWDRAGAIDAAVMAQLAELGFLGMLAPESVGGMALDHTAMLGVIEQLAWGEASVALAVALHTQVGALLDRHGSAEARERWLPALASGQVIGCAQATWEEEAPVRASPAGDRWILDGSLPWVGNARPTGLLGLVASADPRMLLCLVPVEEAGVELGAPVPTMGLRPLALRTVTLHAVPAVAAAVLGPEQLRAQASEAALCVAAVAAGIGRAALDHARDYADVREQFGRRLRMFEGIRFKLADMALRVGAARALLQRAARRGGDSASERSRPEAARPDQRAPATGADASLAKVAAAEAAMYASTEAVQVFGGYGYMRDYPVEKLMRDGKAMSLLGGTDDWHRERIAEQLYAD